MKEKPKRTGRTTANDSLPYEIAIAIAQGVGTGVGAVAATAAIHSAKKIILKKKADAENPKIILTDK
jgi:hypothetical protein